jgi:hypothetical protein
MHKISVRTRSSYFDDSQLFKMKNLEDENKYQQDDIGSLHRRGFIQTIAKTATLLSIVPLPAVAGEVGAKITRAVTTSDLGISVRTSVGTLNICCTQLYALFVFVSLGAYSSFPIFRYSQRCSDHGQAGWTMGKFFR